jgi:hypothetical protein
VGGAVKETHQREGSLQILSSSAVLPKMEEQLGDLVELEEEERREGWVGVAQRGQEGDVQIHSFSVPEGGEGGWRRASETSGVG